MANYSGRGWYMYHPLFSTLPLIKNENSTYFSKVGKVQNPLFARVSADRFSLVKAAILIKIAFNKKRETPGQIGKHSGNGGRANPYQLPIHWESDGGGVSLITLNTTFDGHVVCGFSSISATFGMA